jgi:Zn-dependent M28 family amino/carboxypeptidase
MPSRFPAFAALLGLTCGVSVLAQQAARPPQANPTAGTQALAARITANALRADVSFLASDLLEGRDTPSRGLDLAAEYIASEFRRMGLEPATGDSFYQAVPIPARPARSGERPRDAAAAGQANNVVGLLRGSDPVLQDTYVILSAHYDHLGLAKSGWAKPGEDRIFNGANDDASGVASVLEIASALAALPRRPKRSVLVILYCGEERGLIGSRYYASHPLAPLDHTVAQINMEQMGRTDSPEGPRLNMMNVTGFDYSTVAATLVDAGTAASIAVVKDAEASDAYFRRSDNGPLADAGIPAHTVSVTYEFPDYHKVSDEWQKLDYDNMARVDQAVAMAAWKLASDATPPQWRESNPKTQRFVEAAKKTRP